MNKIICRAVLFLTFFSPLSLYPMEPLRDSFASNIPLGVTKLLKNKYTYLGLASIVTTYGGVKLGNYVCMLRKFNALRRNLPQRFINLRGQFQAMPKMEITSREDDIKPTAEVVLNNPLTFETFNDVLDLFFHTLKRDPTFTDRKRWANKSRPELFLRNLEKETVPFNPYIQKIIFPAGSKIKRMGDLHGDIHSLLATLEKDRVDGYLDEEYRIIKPERKYAFFGDFVDRGFYGDAVIAFICYFKCINGDNVILCRGNHEDEDINTRELKNSFRLELKNKYNQSPEVESIYQKCMQKICNLFHIPIAEKPERYQALFDKVKKFYECLPLYTVAGTIEGPDPEDPINYELMLHGAPEIGITPHPLWQVDSDIAFSRVTTVARETELNKLCENDEIREMFKDFLFGHYSTEQLSAEDLKEWLCNDTYCPDFNWVDFTITGIRTNHPILGSRIVLGSQWNDVQVLSDEVIAANEPEMRNEEGRIVKPFPFVKQQESRGFLIGEHFNKALLMHFSDRYNRVQMVSRGHQHTDDSNDPMMQSIFNKGGHGFEENIGVSKLWQIEKQRLDLDESGKGKNRETGDDEGTTSEGTRKPHDVWHNLVCTYNVAPCTPYRPFDPAAFNFATVGELTTAPKFEDWQLKIDRLTIIE